ncbi:winged helix-turn-helix domain-containing protein [Pilimelia columellifera]|uniref:Winged helix-turn-helix domain-containing protein n=1 Tax=Pilimelia columellifera subsp. columellifera TaxID=706583 RepID=A0ABP6B106_9ACTN
MRIVFSTEGLARVRLFSSYCPVSETVFAARLLARSAGALLFDRWRRNVRLKLGDRAAVVQSLTRSIPPTAELFRIPVPAFDTEAAALCRTSDRPDVLSSNLRRFHDLAVAPYARAMSSFLESDRAARGNILLGAGIDGFLRSQHPLISWEAPVLHIANGSDRTLRIDERGLLISPSLFYFDRPDVFVPANDPSLPPVLVYTPSITMEAANRLWSSDERTERALAALLGRTRSRLLGALSATSTTTELGRRLGVSAASVSQHTGVLREAGLITTHRRQNTVQHSLTPLGVALVNRMETANNLRASRYATPLTPAA